MIPQDERSNRFQRSFQRPRGAVEKGLYEPRLRCPRYSLTRGNKCGLQIEARWVSPSPNPQCCKAPNSRSDTEGNEEAAEEAVRDELERETNERNLFGRFRFIRRLFRSLLR